MSLSRGGVLTGVTYNRTTDTSYLSFCGSTDWDNGAGITLSGKDRTDYNGRVTIRAKDSSHVTELILKPDGTATWGGTAISLAGHTHTKANITDFPTIPTNTSQLANDSGFITADGAAYPRRVGGVTMNFNWSGQGGQPTWLWGGEDGTNMYVYNPANFSVNYANSAGSVAWGNVSDRPWAVSQFTNDSGFITSWSLMYINGDRAHNAYRIVYGLFNNFNNISTGRCWVSFPNAFSSAPTVVMTIYNPDGLYNYQISNVTTTGFIAEIWDGSGNRTGNGVAGSYIAIGGS